MLKSIKRRTKHITFEYTGDNEEDSPKNVTHVRVLSGVTKITNSAFQDRVRLESISLPPTVVDLGVGHSCNAII